MATSQIKKVYMVTCGICEETEPIYDVRKRASLDNKLREFGWKMIREHGWVCPVCQKGEENDGLRL